MPYQPPVRIRSVDDIPAAIAWAGENSKNRWYVARMAKAFNSENLIPEDWDEAVSPGAARRITSEQSHMDSAMIDDAVATGEVPAETGSGDDGESGEAITAALGRKRRTQKIQTEAGVKRYGAPIGTPIILKDGKLVADLKRAVRLDPQGKVAEAPAPNNKVRSIAIDKIEEGDEIIGKSGRELVVVSNKQGEGYHYELKTADADGKRFDFTVPPGGRIRLIEDDNELDDDDERDTPTPVDPAHVLESKAALKAARKALRRGEKGVTPKTVAAARQKVVDAEAQLDAQMKPPNGEKLERADKAPKPPSTPEPATSAGPRGTKSKTYHDAYEAYLKRASELDTLAARGGQSYTARLAADPKILELRATMDEELKAGNRRIPTGRSAYPASTYDPNARPTRTTPPRPAPTAQEETPEPELFTAVDKAPEIPDVPQPKQHKHDVDIEENVTFGGQTEYFVRVNGTPVFETRKTGVTAQSTADMIAARYRDADPANMSELDGAPYLPEKGPKKPAATPAPDSPDWSDVVDMRGNALVPGAEYRINRRTGKIWTIESRNDDGSFKLVAADGATGGRNTRSRVNASTLVPVNEPEPEPAATVERPPVSDEELAGLRKDSKRKPLKVGQGYKISSRGAVVWEIDSINSDGTLELRPTGDSHGNRRRHNVKPSKMIPVDAETPASPDAPATDRKSKLAEMQAKVDAAPAPEDAARDALQRDLDTMGALHQKLFDVEQEMASARRINAWGEERAEIQTRIDKAQKNYLMAKMDVKSSRRSASALGVDLPDPPDPALPRITPPAARVRAEARPQVQGLNAESTDPEYFTGLNNRDLLEVQTRANRTQYGKPVGSEESRALIDAELRKRDEQWYGPKLEEKPEEELYALLDAAGEKADAEEIERIMKEIDRREEEDNLANTDDVWDRIGMRVANGTHPMEAESEETGRPLDAIIRRESLNYLRQHYSIGAGVPYERAITHAYMFEVEADMRRAEDQVRGGQFLNQAGRRAGIQQIELWTTTSEDRAIRFASDDLAEYWQNHGGRITRQSFKESVKTAIGAPGAGNGQYTDGGSAGFLR